MHREEIAPFQPQIYIEVRAPLLLEDLMLQSSPFKIMSNDSRWHPTRGVLALAADAEAQSDDLLLYRREGLKDACGFR